MSRIPAVPREQAGLFGKFLFRMAKKRYGVMPEPFAVSLHHRGVTFASGMHEMLAERASKQLPKSVRELAVYRAAVRLGCEWCIDFGTMLQRLDGLDIERLREIDS